MSNADPIAEPNPKIIAPAGAPFDIEAAVERAGAAAEAVRTAASPDAMIAVVEGWNQDAARLQTWAASQSIRFRCNTADPKAQDAKRRLDAAAPRIAEARRVFLAAIVGDGKPHAAPLRERFGDTVVDRWQAELRTFDPAVSDLIAEEQSIQSEYMALVGGAMVTLRGETRTLSSVLGLLFDGDRELRREAAICRWNWFTEQREALDDQFDRLVKCRTELAARLGHGSFTDLAYDRMRRTDYDAADVARFREAIERNVVPVATELREEQRVALGVDTLHVFDEQVQGTGSEPQPLGNAAWLEDRAAEMFEALDAKHGTKISTLFAGMRSNGLLDLVQRPAKGPGGFCSFLDGAGLPFVFANFNGSSGDARVFTHEIGHAYQGWCSHQSTDLIDQRRCTSESAEIHSMSLEFLTGGEMERFFGDHAEHFRTSHRTRAITFLPYGCAIDHFQHEVYANPSWSPAERHAAWRDIERRYLPSRSWDGIEAGTSGAAWQAQLHVYQYPFYYIDYVLAQLVAFQFAALAKADEALAWSRYQRLCDLGGTYGFRRLVAEVEMNDPFEHVSVR